MSVASDRRDYQFDYYQRHKEKLAEKRKERYYSNPEVRQRAIEAARKHRARKRAEREHLRALGKIPRRKKTEQRPLFVEIDGDEKPLYRISVLAERIGRTVDTLNKWISSGSVPQTPFRTRRGDRMYTSGMILVVKMAVQNRGIVGKDPEMHDEIVEGWDDLGVKVGERYRKVLT